MTTKQLKAIEEMNKSGINDAQIAEEIGKSASTVNIWRRRLGLKRVGVNRVKVRYSVYDAKTTQFICEGTVRECANALGLKCGTFHSYCTYVKNGQRCKYEIHRVIEDEEN